METIHFKTIDPFGQELLSRAARTGTALNWERYEMQQPQDGFLRLGLSCPYGCLQGPCRIDPFGRGASHGICGLDGDGMAAALLLRLMLQGALETLSDGATDPRLEISSPGSLGALGTEALKRLGGFPLTAGEIFQSAALLSRPGRITEEFIYRALRLGLLTVYFGFQTKPQETACTGEFLTGYGLLAPETFHIALVGLVSEEIVQMLTKETDCSSHPRVQLVTLGDWIRTDGGFLPLVCTSGEAETALSAGKIRLLVAGPRANPGLLALAERMKIPVLSDKDGSEVILGAIRDNLLRPHPSYLSPDRAFVVTGKVPPVKELELSLDGKLALIGGTDTLQMSLGHLPVTLGRALIAEGYTLAGWNDAALWLVKEELPVRVLPPQEGPLVALKALAAAGRLDVLQGICFTGLRDCRELSLAVGLAALGMKVAVATPVPLWGSGRTRLLLQEKLSQSGGSFTHFDHPATAEELLDWFLKG